MITLVVAKNENNVIGEDNQLIWHLPNDLKHFKQITSGHPIIMGRKTFESVGKPLPNRTNIVITRNKSWKAEDVLVVYSLEEAIEIGQKIDEQIFIIGGGVIFELSMKVADAIELTQIHNHASGDSFFPAIDPKIWQEISREDFEKDGKNPFDYSFIRYERRNPIRKLKEN